MRPGMCSRESGYRLSCFEGVNYGFMMLFSLWARSKNIVGALVLTLEYGSIPDDETLELSADNLQARLHVAACGYLIPLLHLLGTAGRAFGLADLQIRTWRETNRDGTEVEMSKGKEPQKPLLFNSHGTEASSFKHRKKDSAASSAC